MKKLVLLLVGLSIFSLTKAQLKPKDDCGEFYIDILDGKINKVRPDFTIEQIKKELPCFSSAEDESATAKCGGGVYFKDRDVTIYTQRDYVEVGEKFKGKLSIPLIGAKKGSLFNYLGNPKVKDTNWEAFQTAYGILVLHYNAAGKVYKFQFSTKTAETLSLCE
jgi:hypothetical protein